MDTKRNKSESFKKNTAITAKKLIEKYKPDLVIARKTMPQNILLLGFNDFTNTKKNKEIVNFVLKNTKIITASWDKDTKEISLIVYSKNQKSMESG